MQTKSASIAAIDVRNVCLTCISDVSALPPPPPSRTDEQGGGAHAMSTWNFAPASGSVITPYDGEGDIFVLGVPTIDSWAPSPQCTSQVRSFRCAQKPPYTPTAIAHGSEANQLPAPRVRKWPHNPKRSRTTTQKRASTRSRWTGISQMSGTNGRRP